MIVEQHLRWMEGKWVRVDEDCVWPHANTFEEFVAEMGDEGGLVTDAPEIDGRILDQEGGRPFRLFSMNDRGGGLGFSGIYGLLWENPNWCVLAPGTVLPPPGTVITFRSCTAKSLPNFSKPPALRSASGRAGYPGSSKEALSGPYTFAEAKRQQAVASDGGRQSRKSRRRKPRN